MAIGLTDSTDSKLDIRWIFVSGTEYGHYSTSTCCPPPPSPATSSPPWWACSASPSSAAAGQQNYKERNKYPHSTTCGYDVNCASAGLCMAAWRGTGSSRTASRSNPTTSSLYCAASQTTSLQLSARHNQTGPCCS